MNSWKKAGKWLVSSLHSLELRWRFRNLWLLFRSQRRWWPAPNLRDLPQQRHYVAFLDLLGFGSKVEHDLDGALDTYDRIFRRIRGMSPSLLPSTTIAVVSDSVLLTSALSSKFFKRATTFNTSLCSRTHWFGEGSGMLFTSRHAAARTSM